jgi:periplasmic protein TonB
MKKNTIFIVFLLFLQISKAQETKLENNEKAFEADSTLVAPIYPGCDEAIDKRNCFQHKIIEHIKDNFKYPRKALRERIQGKVMVYFIIEKDGSITVYDVKGPDPILEEEAKRIIEKTPKIVPGTQKRSTCENDYDYSNYF